MRPTFRDPWLNGAGDYFGAEARRVDGWWTSVNLSGFKVNDRKSSRAQTICVQLLKRCRRLLLSIMRCGMNIGA
jgi:hypothetical protein